MLFVIGEKETSKKTSIRLLFHNLEELDLINNKDVDEIDLSSYGFNLGYNAFLTDLYEKLNSSSQCVLFKNIEQASEEILNTIRDFYPNTCISLKNDYII